MSISINKKQNIGNVKNISVEFNGNYYNVIYGTHENGAWFSIPNWNAGGELSSWYSDIFWNTESIVKSLKSKKVAKAKAIAKAIAEAIAYAENNNKKIIK